jgi:hypothetical protein
MARVTSSIVAEIWPELPSSIKKATHESPPSHHDINIIRQRLPRGFEAALERHGIAADAEATSEFLMKTLENYVKEVCSPVLTSTKTQGYHLSGKGGVICAIIDTGHFNYAIYRWFRTCGAP